MLSGLRGGNSVAELCRREEIVESLYYSWSKEALEASRKRLSGDTARQTEFRRGNLTPRNKASQRDSVPIGVKLVRRKPFG